MYEPKAAAYSDTAPQTGSPGHCVGRERELARVSERFHETQRGQGAFVLVTGEGGLGKATFLSEAATRLRETKALVLQSKCRPGLPSYRPMVEIGTGALQQLYASSSQPEPEVLSRWEQVLETLDGRLSLSEPGQDPASVQIQLFDRYAELIRFTSTTRPLVLVVHDLDFADQGTLDLLRFLGRLLTSSPELSCLPFGGLVLASASQPSVVSPDRAWCADVNLEILDLKALDEQGVKAFLGSDDVVRRVLKASGGVPGRLENFLLDTAERTSPTPVAGLDDASVRVLRVLAVVGRPLGPDALRGLTKLPQEKLARSIAGLTSRRLVEKVVVNGEIRIAFARAVDQSAVYGEIPSAERRELHLQAGEHLQTFGQECETEACAHHLLEAGAGERAVRKALEAGQRLEISCSFQRATDLYSRALEQTTDERLQQEIIDRLCTLSEITGSLERALEYAHKLRQRCPDPEVSLRIARLHILADDVAAARAELESLPRRCRRIGGSRGSHLRARVLAETAEVKLMEGRTDEALQTCQQGLALCDEAAVDRNPELGGVRIQLCGLQGKIHMLRQEQEQALCVFLHNLDAARALGRPLDELRMLVQLGQVHLQSGGYEQACSFYEQARSLAEKLGEHRLLGVCLQHMGVLAERRRDYRRALELYQQAVGVWKRTGHRGYLAWVAMDLGQLYLELGDLARARALAGLATRLMESEPPTAVRINLELLLGQIAQSECRFGEAADRFQQARAMALQAGQTERLTRSLLALAGLQLERGEARETLRLLREEVDLPSAGALRLRSLLLWGQAAWQLEELEEAQARLTEGVELADALSDAEGLWRAQYLISQVTAQQGRPAEARRWLAAAACSERDARAMVPEELMEALSGQPLRTALQQALSAQREDAKPDAVAAAANALPVPARTAPQQSDWRRRYREIVGEHPRLMQVLHHVDRVAPTDTTVLVRGESGTGKELIARAVHDQSLRADKPLVTVNCSALVESLLLSELFGHERGAFTGATQRKRGRFEVADGGTIFLDEIGDISPRTQAALLRVLQEREFERVGGTEPIKVDVRIICATNRDLEAMVARGEFREDLYYRLRGVQLFLPALRERKEDIPLLAQRFLEQISRERGTVPKRLSARAEHLLCTHRWPGNIRELSNVLRSISLLADSDLLDVEAFFEYPELASASRSLSLQGAMPVVEGTAAGALAPDPALPPSLYQKVREEGLSLKDLKSRIEVECIVEAMAESGGNITKAAKLLGMKRPRLSQLIKEHGITAC